MERDDLKAFWRDNQMKLEQVYYGLSRDGDGNEDILKCLDKLQGWVLHMKTEEKFIST